MKIDSNELREKLDNYFTGKISRMDLGEWANKAYYDLLKGSYVESEKIVIYPFLKTISTFHLEENDKDDEYPCSEESVKKIQDILYGKITFDFDVEMSIPIQVYTMFMEKPYYDKERRDNFSKLRNVIAHNFEQGLVSSDDIAMQLNTIMCPNCQIKTVQGLLEEHIFRFLRILHKSGFAEEGMQECYKLYAQKSEQNLIVEKLLNYLDCYIGNKSFHLLVSFKKGRSDILLVV